MKWTWLGDLKTKNVVKNSNGFQAPFLTDNIHWFESLEFARDNHFATSFGSSIDFHFWALTDNFNFKLFSRKKQRSWNLQPFLKQKCPSVRIYTFWVYSVDGWEKLLEADRWFRTWLAGWSNPGLFLSQLGIKAEFDTIAHRNHYLAGSFVLGQFHSKIWELKCWFPFHHMVLDSLYYLLWNPSCVHLAGHILLFCF